MDAAWLEAGTLRELLQDEECARAGQRAPARVEEELRPVTAVEVRTAEGEVTAHRLGRGAAERDEALLSTLPDDADDALVEAGQELVVREVEAVDAPHPRRPAITEHDVVGERQ